MESGSLRLCHLLALGQNASDLSKPQFPHLENGDENIDFIAVRVEWRIRQLDTCWFPPATLPAVAPTCRWGAGRTVWWGRTLFSSLLPGGGLGGRGRNGGGGEKMVLRRPRAVRRWLRRPPTHPPPAPGFPRHHQTLSSASVKSGEGSYHLSRVSLPRRPGHGPFPSFKSPSVLQAVGRRSLGPQLSK